LCKIFGWGAVGGITFGDIGSACPAFLRELFVAIFFLISTKGGQALEKRISTSIPQLFIDKSFFNFY
jgi:hypothetical protein